MAVECCEEATHVFVCILGCLGFKQYADRFKLEPTWTYFLSLFWPVLDVIGDILFLFTELMSTSTALALAAGPVPIRVLYILASVSIVVSIWKYDVCSFAPPHRRLPKGVGPCRAEGCAPTTCSR